MSFISTRMNQHTKNPHTPKNKPIKTPQKVFKILFYRFLHKTKRIQKREEELSAKQK
jgi:hypothetical protein